MPVSTTQAQPFNASTVVIDINALANMNGKWDALALVSKDDQIQLKVMNLWERFLSLFTLSKVQRASQFKAVFVANAINSNIKLSKSNFTVIQDSVLLNKLKTNLEVLDARFQKKNNRKPLLTKAIGAVERQIALIDAQKSIVEQESLPKSDPAAVAASSQPQQPPTAEELEAQAVTQAQFDAQCVESLESLVLNARPKTGKKLGEFNLEELKGFINSVMAGAKPQPSETVKEAVLNHVIAKAAIDKARLEQEHREAEAAKEAEAVELELEHQGELRAEINAHMRDDIVKSFTDLAKKSAPTPAEFFAVLARTQAYLVLNKKGIMERVSPENRMSYAESMTTAINSISLKIVGKNFQGPSIPVMRDQLLLQLVELGL